MTRWMTTTQLMEYLSCSENSAKKIAEKANAKSKIGRLVRYDRNAIDAYIEGQEVQTAWETR